MAKKNPRLSHLVLIIFILAVALVTVLSLKLSYLSKRFFETRNRAKDQSVAKIVVVPEESITPSPATKTVAQPTPTTAADNSPWGIAKQIDSTTWTMRVGQDATMATPNEIFDALNRYRQQKGRGNLSWNDKLANFADSRAKTFQSIEKLDGHAGFNDYFKDEQHMKDIGFWGLGENSSYGFRMQGVHLIEWVFAGDADHDNNQLDPSWTHVGIGVAGTGVDVVFGKDKI